MDHLTRPLAWRKLPCIGSPPLPTRALESPSWSNFFRCARPLHLDLHPPTLSLRFECPRRLSIHSRRSTAAKRLPPVTDAGAKPGVVRALTSGRPRCSQELEKQKERFAVWARGHRLPSRLPVLRPQRPRRVAGAKPGCLRECPLYSVEPIV